MVGFVVTGHGNFASGLLSAIKLIAGEQEQIVAVDFLQDDSTDDLKNNLSAAIDSLGEEVIVFADLMGGSPFNNAVLLQQEKKEQQIEVIAGTNLPMLLESAFMREGVTAAELAKSAVVTGKAGLITFQIQTPAAQDDFEEDGI